MEKKQVITTSLSVAAGVVIAALVIWGIYTLNQDHKKLNEVVTFLNNQIALSQKSAQTVQK